MEVQLKSDRSYVKQECIPVGFVPAAAVILRYRRWCLGGGGSGLGVSGPRRVSGLGRGVWSLRKGLRREIPCEQTNAFENITFPILRMRSVMKKSQT